MWMLAAYHRIIKYEGEVIILSFNYKVLITFNFIVIALTDPGNNCKSKIILLYWFETYGF